MTQSSRLTKSLFFILISSFSVASCGASELTVYGDLSLQLIPQKTSLLKKTAGLVSGLLWIGISVASFAAIVDAFSNRTKDQKLLQGGLGITALLVSLYKLGFFEESDSSYDCDHGCGCACHGCHDSCHDCSCYNCSCCQDACCSGYQDACCHDYQDSCCPGCYERPYFPEIKIGYDCCDCCDDHHRDSQIKTITVQTVSNDVVCNGELSDFWEDPFNY